MPQFHCPHCTGLFQVDDALVGQQAACPHCQGLVMIATGDAADASEPAAESPAVHEGFGQLACPLCSGQFQVTTEMLGQEVLCPVCHQSVTIPTALPAAESTDTSTTAPRTETTPTQELPADSSTGIVVQDKPRTVRVGDEIIELRRLTPEEKARRRLIKNLIIIGFGSFVLMTYLFYHVGVWPFER